ncbi:MAG: hypothetical protein ACYTJ0_08090, partial [Planctomycetota bacterium]
MTGCTFTGNELRNDYGDDAAGQGAAVFVGHSAAAAIRNSVLFSNTPDQVFDETGGMEVHFSDIEGGWTG